MEFCFALRFAFSSDFSTEIQQQWAATSTPTPPLPTPPLPPSRRPFAQPPFLSVHGRVCECSTCVCVSADFSGDRLSGLTLPTPLPAPLPPPTSTPLPPPSPFVWPAFIWRVGMRQCVRAHTTAHENGTEGSSLIYLTAKAKGFLCS